MTTAPIPTAELERIIAVSEFDGIVVYEDCRRLARELIAAREVLQRYVNACLAQNINLGPITGDAIALLPSAGQETE